MQSFRRMVCTPPGGVKVPLIESGSLGATRRQLENQSVVRAESRLLGRRPCRGGLVSRLMPTAER
jgi:hypothetical protein